MSSTPTDSPIGTPIQPMHNPSQAAHVVVPQAPLGNATNGQLPGMGAKALLAKKFAKSQNPMFVSPTDNMLTPVSQKLNQTKKKHFAKGAAKPMPSLFNQQQVAGSDSDQEEPASQTSAAPPSSSAAPMDEDENPF
ncbi:uncharacterized protein BXZ73DRAFT_102791 [Epithele typhae]|uniref:uncharacterized protein n=1 Tax=Epithele typhae TaxID=378194 RepID=UPI002008717A|nr:uncharacterized protein BXZ73DRAFT_102791 [Epithele typhae]KAH9927205.1 hypothetical protein BXZ73DRAFT_102791 [Epithele typhae]